MFRYIQGVIIMKFFLALEGMTALLSRSSPGFLPSTSPVITFSTKLPEFSIAFSLQLTLLSLTWKLNQIYVGGESRNAVCPLQPS